MQKDVSRRAFLAAAAVVPLSLTGSAEPNDWIDLFDGHSLAGWRPSENKNSWTVVDGKLSANGPRSHLFYNGAVHGADFKNFELMVELTTRPNCNSGIYFHTAYQETGFPEKGFEVQVNNTALGDGGYLERKKTGSLYGLRNMYKQLVPDEKPFQTRIAVRGKNVQIRLNDELVVDYVEPTPPVVPAGGEKQRFLDHGTFALQCHNDGSKAAFRSVRVRPLADDLPAYVAAPPVVDDVFREVINVGRHNVPLVDYHAYLRPGLTLERALQKSRASGIQLGITAEASRITNDAAAEQWLKPLGGKPVFFALSAESGGWTRRLSKQAAQGFDYVLADCRAITLEQTISRFETEPIDIYAHPIDLSANPKSQAKLIDSLVRNKIAVELNSTDLRPSRAFVMQAKAAGCKFAFGTANQTAGDLKRCEYGLQLVEECQLTWQNFFAPGAWWPKAVDRRWPGAS